MATIVMTSDEKRNYPNRYAERLEHDAGVQYSRTGEVPEGYQMSSNLIEPNWGDQGASYTKAMISRAEWEDYKQRFRPYEDKLMSMYGSKDLDKQISRNQQAVKTSFDNSAKQASDMRRLYNTNMTRRQFGQYKANLNMRQSMAKVHATNMSRLARKDRNMELLAGSASQSQTIARGAAGE